MKKVTMLLLPMQLKKSIYRAMMMKMFKTWSKRIMMIFFDLRLRKSDIFWWKVSISIALDVVLLRYQIQKGSWCLGLSWISKTQKRRYGSLFLLPLFWSLIHLQKVCALRKLLKISSKEFVFRILHSSSFVGIMLLRVWDGLWGTAFDSS